jgi:hypothetical protein
MEGLMCHGRTGRCQKKFRREKKKKRERERQRRRVCVRVCVYVCERIEMRELKKCGHHEMLEVR